MGELRSCLLYGAYTGRGLLLMQPSFLLPYSVSLNILAMTYTMEQERFAGQLVGDQFLLAGQGNTSPENKTGD